MGINFIDPDRLDIDLAPILLIGEGGGDPAVLIDDTAGAGATGKTWSAAKLAAEFAALRDYIDAKVDSGGPYTAPPWNNANGSF